MGSFYEKLSYSIGNEDASTEQEALQLTPQCRVISVTASGDRPLNLLTTECKELLSIDANPVQNHLLKLKAAAMQTLDYPDYLAFLGLEEEPNRLKWFKEMASKLDEPSQQFWQKNQKMIAKGVIYQGTVERLCQLVSFLIQMARGSKIKKLFEFDDLEEQKNFLEKNWETPFWKGAFNFCLHPWMTRLFIGDPGLYLTIDPTITPGKYIYHHMHSFLKRRLAKESLLLSLVLKGKVQKEAYSPYLTEEGIKKIRPRLDKVKVYTAHLVEFLENAEENSIDRFSLSDVASYLKQPDYIRMIKAMYRAARPGARFCLRQFLSSHEIPSNLNSYFKREYGLEEKLQEKENCFLYRFNVGTIVK